MANRDREMLLVASGDSGTRRFASALFRRAGFVTREVGSGEETLAVFDEGAPELVLIDLKLEDMSGHELCYELRERFGADLPIILISDDRTEPSDRAAGILIGADDYLAKPFDPDELLARARRLLSRTRQTETGRDSQLTPRETEVLSLLAEGFGRDTVADKLFISPKTVATHVQHILTKLGVHSSTEAVARAYRTGLVVGR